MISPWNRRRKISENNEQFYIPVRDRRKFDDDPMNPGKRAGYVFKGNLRSLHLDRIYKGVPWQFFCESVQMFNELFSTSGSQECYKDCIKYSAMLCSTLSYRPKWKEVMDKGFDTQDIFGNINKSAMIAWCALCQLAGASSYDCVGVWKGNEYAVNLIKMCFRSFDRLDNKVYTDKDIDEMVVNADSKDR